MAKYNLGEFLLNNIKNNVDDDIIVIETSDKIEIKIHKCIARKSELFNIYLNEIKLGSIVRINLPFDFESIDKIRNYLYLDKLIITLNNFMDLFRISDYLSIEELVLLIINRVFDAYLSIDNAISIYKMIKASSLSEGNYLDRINKYIEDNISKIILCEHIKSLSLKAYTKLINNKDLNQQLILESIKLWLSEKNIDDKKILFNIFLENDLIHPGLLGIKKFWTDFIFYINKLDIKIDNKLLLKHLELASFNQEINLKTKGDLEKYLWAMNIQKNYEIDIQNGFIGWSSAVIDSRDYVKGNNKYMDKVILKVKLNTSFNNTIYIPNDIEKISFLYSKSDNWRNTLELGSGINVTFNGNAHYNAKIIFLKNKELIIYSSNGYYMKTNIYSDKLSYNSFCSIKYNNYFLINNQNIEITVNIFDQMENNIKYTENEISEFSNEID